MSTSKLTRNFGTVLMLVQQKDGSAGGWLNADADAKTLVAGLLAARGADGKPLHKLPEIVDGVVAAHAALGEEEEEEETPSRPVSARSARPSTASSARPNSAARAAPRVPKPKKRGVFERSNLSKSVVELARGYRFDPKAKTAPATDCGLEDDPNAVVLWRAVKQTRPELFHVKPRGANAFTKATVSAIMTARPWRHGLEPVDALCDVFQAMHDAFHAQHAARVPGTAGSDRKQALADCHSMALAAALARLDELVPVPLGEE
jgi:hypothetical protein